ncbi:hypothetical protein, partial [Mycobacterium tuberculosis]|uniref:hypothetical protein n=1 Tax=Mycobacterium tuberculosis TaxID=1773 RepID=UPI003C6DC7A7
PTRRAFGQMARAATGWVSVSGQFAVAADTCRCEGTLFAVDPETHVANHNRCDIVGRLRDERPNTLRSEDRRRTQQRIMMPVTDAIADPR